MGKSILTTILTVTIAVICVATILVPTLSDATKTEETFTNEGYFRMTHYDDTTDHTVSWTADEPKIITVDNVDVPIDYDVANGQVTVIADTNWIVRLYTDSSGEATQIGLNLSTGSTTNASSSATITLTSGTMSATMDSTTKTGTYTDIYVPSLTGEYIMKDASVDAYINADSDVVGYGLTRIQTSEGLIGGAGVGLSFIGNYEDGITATVWRGADSTTLTNATMNVTELSKYVDLYTMESITATATYTETVDDETVTTNTDVTYNYLLVPYEVTSELSQHFTDAENNLIKTIPVLIICAILIMTVGMLYFRNRD